MIFINVVCDLWCVLRGPHPAVNPVTDQHLRALRAAGLWEIPLEALGGEAEAYSLRTQSSA